MRISPTSRLGRPARLLATSVVVGSLALAGCAADDGDPSGAGGGDGQEGHLDPADHELHLPEATLVIDAELEGGCAWVTAPDGAAYEVGWPDGYAVDFARLALIGPDGEVAAEDGDPIEVGGTPEPLVGTFCQVGTVLDADAVVTADR